MKVTQQDIARLASVSQATVSRVVAGDTRVEEDIRQRVMAVMRAHNYRPDVRARSLRQQKTNLIGLVMKREARDLQGDPFFSMFLSEILGTLSSTPYHLCVDIADSTLRQEYIYDELLRTKRVDGLILVESEPKDRRVLSLQQEGFPFVLIGNPGENAHLPSVDNDNVRAGHLATEHLLDQGYQRIAFLAGPESLTVTSDRVQGYREAVKAAKGQPKVIYSDFGLQAARHVALQMLAETDRPDALVVMDDFMAMGVVQAARELSLPIPSHLGLASFNDTNVCDLMPGGLTSVSLNLADLAKKAVGKLLRIVESRTDGEGTRSIVGCDLMVRGSSRRTPEVALR
jgi:DNA-binding LacI/PurR family transcriptional regulator